MLRNLRWSIFLLGAMGVLVALAIAAQGYWLKGRMEHNADAVFIAKDVVADILPPLMYLIEARLLLSQAVEGTMERAEAKTKFDQLVADYEARVAHWRKNPPHGLERQLLGRQQLGAQKFIATARTEVIEPLQSGNVDAARAGITHVHALYLEHRSGVDETVMVGNRFAETSMAQFAASHANSDMLALGLAAGGVLLVLLAYRIVLRSVQRPVEACTNLARRIAEGDLVPHGDADRQRSDSIGQLQQALRDTQSMLAAQRTAVSTVEAGRKEGVHTPTRTHARTHARTQ